MLRRRYRVVLAVAGVAVLALTALVLSVTGLTGSTAAGDREATAPKSGESDTADRPGLGPNTAEAYLQAERTYPANVIPQSVVQDAAKTFNQIASQPASQADNGNWNQYGPKVNAIQPADLSFSGATSPTASRITALATAQEGHFLYAGAAGGGVWVTANPQSPDPTWTQITHGLAQNSVGTIVVDPTDQSGRTIYLGTGEANRCTSGCEAGVGIYKSTNGGISWTKLADTCVDNSTYHCVTPGKDAFLGRAIGNIVIDPTNPRHIFVGSALAVRGLSHVIGAGSTSRLEPDANPVGLYESHDGGQTFTEVWNGGQAGSFGINDVELDPKDPTTVYASAFDQGLWRRSPSLDGSATPFDFSQVFKPQFVGLGPPGDDRTMFATTLKDAKTRVYLVEGTAGGSNPATFANFWRTDNADQSASTLLASQAAGSTEPAPSTVGPQTYNGWQKLTSHSTASPYYATDNFCTGQCWYDEAVYTPKGMPDTVYVIGSYLYGELPCNTRGVGCGNGRSNGRAVLYSTSAGDPQPVTTADGTNTTRTFTDLTFDAQDRPGSSCPYDGHELDFGGVTAPFQCMWAPDGIHPDQHAIVINPSDPTQIFEGSDGGVIRTSGTFSDISQHCNHGERPLLGLASLENCKRLLSRVPTVLDHTDKFLGSTIQFVGVAINPSDSKNLQGGTQDNGTWSNIDPHDGTVTWPQVIYGDGGNSGYDKTNPTWRFNEFTFGFGDSNFHDGAGGPLKWVFTTSPIANSGEAINFYWTAISDPNPPTYNGSITHPIFQGAQHVWRTWAFGAGTPGAVPQDTTPNIPFYEANCPDLLISGSEPFCGDYQPLGGPAGSNTAGDLTGTVYGSDRTGGSVSWIARTASDHDTLWAATSAGRIFVTHNANAVNPASVVWTRVDNASSPTRFVSSIYIDPTNTNHAWVSYSGYNAATPTTPGHVFSVTASGTFTNLNIESGTSTFPTPTDDGDLPVADITRDDQTHTLYAATDFGVLKGADDGTHGWVVMNGLPRYEIMHLAISPSSREPSCSGSGCKKILYAATHSHGIWSLNLGGGS